MPTPSGFRIVPTSSEFDEDFDIQFSEEQVEQFYIPLAGRLIDRSDGLPVFIGIAGPPGSGKTTFSHLLAATIEQVMGVERCAVCIGMDGWHYPNTYLESHFSTIDGNRLALKRIKGSPQTFDLESFNVFMHAARRGKTHSYPIYSRKLHDVIRDAGKIHSQTRFYLFEGNYLHLDMPGWKDVAQVFDWRIFIDAPTPVLRTALRIRHLRGGKDANTIEAFIEEVDLKNAILLRENRIPAHVEILKSDEIKIGEMRYLISSLH